MCLRVVEGASAPGPDLDAGLETTATVQRQVRERAARFMKKHAMVGMSIGVIDGSSSFTLNFGEVRAGSGVEPTSVTLYEIGSISKTFTSVVLAELVLKGRVRLDQPVKELLPVGQRVPQFEGREIRLVDLATHTSGLPRLPAEMIFAMFIPGVALNPYKWYDAEDLYSYLGSYELRRKPGEKYDYSNLGVGLLGLALARTAGTSYNDMVKRVICEPLAMDDTAVQLTDDQTSRLARGHSDRVTLKKVGVVEEASNWDFQDTFAGAGGMKSTTQDLMRYLSANLRVTAGNLEETLAFSHGTRFADGSTTLGLGWHKLNSRSGGELIYHDGGTGGYSSMMVFSVSRKEGVVVLCNKFESAVGRLGLDVLELLEEVGP